MGVKLITDSGLALKQIISQLKEHSVALCVLFKNLQDDGKLQCGNLYSGLNQLMAENESILDTANLINDSCNVALETLSDMLTFDKIDEKKLVLELGEFDPWILINEAMRPFQINAKNADVKLSSHCIVNNVAIDDDANWLEEGSPRPVNLVVKVDKFKLNQVIRNLISNSLKFTPANGEVKLIVEFKSSSSVRLSVIDTGHGISKENQSKLFGQYVQFNAGALQQGKGSGLGLWIAKSMIFLIVVLNIFLTS
jgi:signal transduction histidine kinase